MGCDREAVVCGIDIGLRFTGFAFVHRELVPTWSRSSAMPVTVEALAARGVVVRTDNLFTTSEKRRNRSADMLVARCIHLLNETFATLASETFLRGAFIEVPSGGAMSSSAAQGMGIAIAVSAEISRLLEVPVETYSANDCKRAVLGCLKVPKKEVRMKDGGTRMESQTKQWVEASMRKRMHFDLGEITKGQHEHVYDASALVVAAQHGNVMRSLGWPAPLFKERQLGASGT